MKPFWLFVLPVAVGLAPIVATNRPLPAQQPEETAAAPAGATARCRDGTYSLSQHRSGTCSHHGGVATWLDSVTPPAPVARNTPSPAPGGAARICGGHCGTERWAIKTLTDRQSTNAINSTPEQTSVGALVALPAPPKLPQSARIAPTETQQFRIEALLIAWKEESGPTGDRDFHLVLADPTDPGRTMIAEIPSPTCASACASAQVDAFGAARQALINELGPAPGTTSIVLVDPPRRVEVTGVGFFDFDHKQSGLAPNCIELHPVLQITVMGSESGAAIPLPSGVSHTCGSRPAAGVARPRHRPPRRPAPGTP